MKKLLTLYENNDYGNGVPFDGNTNLMTTINLFAEYARDYQDCEIIRAPIQNYDFERNIFKGYWEYRDGEWVKNENEVKPDLIFDKMKIDKSMVDFPRVNQIAVHYKYFNNPYFTLFVKNKLSQIFGFQDFMAKSQFANNEVQIKNLFDKIPGDKIVVKKLWGSGGYDMYIDDKDIEKIKATFDGDLDQNFIVQEFKEFKKDEDGQLADLRLVFGKGKLVFSVSRIAVKDSLFTNTHQGAVTRIVPLEELPKAVVDMGLAVSKKMEVFGGGLYSLDFMVDKDDKPVLIESNTVPGFFHSKELVNPEKLSLQNAFYDAVINFY